MLSSYALLAVGLLATCLPPRLGSVPTWAVWAPALVVSLAVGWWAHVLRPTAVLSVVLLWVLAEGSRRWAARDVGRWCTVGAVVLAVLLGLRLVPGFEPLVVATDVQLSPTSSLLTLRASYDKGVAGMLLMALIVRRSSPERWTRAIGIGFAIGLLTAVPLVGIAWATGGVDFDPKLPDLAAWWVAINLLQTCVMEEALFRGVVLDRLARAWRSRRHHTEVAVAVSALLFGMAHLGGGLHAVVLASLAGVGYGLAFVRGGGVEAGIAAHFAVNAVHFLGYSYPYASRLQ